MNSFESMGNIFPKDVINPTPNNILHQFREKVVIGIIFTVYGQVCRQVVDKLVKYISYLTGVVF